MCCMLYLILLLPGLLLFLTGKWKPELGQTPFIVATSDTTMKLTTTTTNQHTEHDRTKCPTATQLYYNANYGKCQIHDIPLDETVTT